MRLDCAMLFVKDFDRMRAFYAAMLGVDPINTEWTDQWALFETGGTRFALHAIAPESADAVRIESPPRPRETASMKLIFAVEDVQREAMRIQALGATLIHRPWQENGASCDAADPEGNVFQIARTRP
jgi:predicted enzyme related to lactoylglutathione lyase